MIFQGFEWKDEGKVGRHKWGYVSWHPGDKILLKARIPVGDPALISPQTVPHAAVSSMLPSNRQAGQCMPAGQHEDIPR
jgi:hypothetical protein